MLLRTPKSMTNQWKARNVISRYENNLLYCSVKKGEGHSRAHHPRAWSASCRTANPMTQHEAKGPWAMSHDSQPSCEVFTPCRTAAQFPRLHKNTTCFHGTLSKEGLKAELSTQAVQRRCFGTSSTVGKPQTDNIMTPQPYLEIHWSSDTVVSHPNLNQSQTSRTIYFGQW